MRIIFVTLIFAILSCKGYESLTKTKAPFLGNQLRLNGYYYSIGKEFQNGFDKDYIDVFTLYQDGVYFNVLKGLIEEELNHESILKNLDEGVQYRVENIENYKDSRPYWGVFSVDNSRIEIQSWEFASDGGAYPTKIIEGTIVNDTTIHFHKIIGAYPNNKGGNKRIEEINNTYYFRKFSPKPDSSNVFID